MGGSAFQRWAVHHEKLPGCQSSIIHTVTGFFVRLNLFIDSFLAILLFFAPQLVKLAEQVSLNRLLRHYDILRLFDFDLLAHDATLRELTLSWTSRKR